jgi:hypothetical protein
MRHATNAAVLVLNASFEPVSICQARRALTLVVKERAVIQEDAGSEVHPGILFPLVIRLKTQTWVPYRVQMLNRKNILMRDRHRCQYCDRKMHPGDLTLDHVIPRSKGGPNTWENLVACCGPCNKRKADRTPEEAGMLLLRRPRPATVHTSRHILRGMGAEDKVWQKYLFFDSSHSEYVTQG